MSRSVSLAALALAALCAAARADVLEMSDGTKFDGKVLKEDGGFIWLKTLQRTEKLQSDKVKSRTPGEADVERYEKIRAASEKEPVTVAALWALYEFQRDHAKDLPPEAAKENVRIVAKVLKKEPDHLGAREANGDVQWKGDWVKKADLPRLVAEEAKEKIRVEWQSRLGVPIEVYEADHFLLLDNTGDKDLAGRGKTLDKAYESLTAALGLPELWKDRCVIATIKSYEPYCKALDGFAAESNVEKHIIEAAKDRMTGGAWRHKPYPWQVRWPSTGTEGMWSSIVHNTAHITAWTLWSKQGRAWEKEFAPAWVEEGLGAWVEIEVMGQQVSSCMGDVAPPKGEKKGGTTDKDPRKKKDPKKNAESLREAANEYKQKCKEAIENETFPAMRDFLKYKVGNLGPAEEGGCLGLVTWLMQVDKDKFGKLVLLLAKGGKKVPDEYFREVYGFELIEDMETKWRAWAVGEW